MQVCFIGHRMVPKSEELTIALKNSIIGLTNNGAKAFLFGSKSEFDDLAWEVVTQLKIVYPFIKRIYVRSSSPYIDKIYENYLLESFEETYYTQNVERVGKLAYVARNYNMIDNCTHCVFYYNKDYIVPLKKKIKNNMILPRERKSGTKIAYQYAKRKKKIIINLYEEFTK